MRRYCAASPMVFLKLTIYSRVAQSMMIALVVSFQNFIDFIA